MATLGIQIRDRAETQVGVREIPLGSNRGGCEKYQLYYGEFYVGLAWCGDFVGWVWGGIDPDFKWLASPSTAVMCDIARSKDLICPPQPGAAFVICGTHTGILHSYLGNGIWRTVEGNSGDKVAWRQRSVDGALVYGPPGLSKVLLPPKPEMVTWYGIEDIKVTQFYGGWGTRPQRARNKEALERRLGRQLREFRDPQNSKAPYMLEDVGVDQYLGLWKNKAGRDKVMARRERELGYDLRPYSIKRPDKTPLVADDLGKVD